MEAKISGLFRRVSKQIQRELHVEFDKNFDREGLFAEKWRRRKNNVDPDRKVLTKTGALRESIESSSGRGGAEIRFTSQSPYARVHNEGLRAGRGKGFQMPKRQFIGDSPEVYKITNEIMERELNRFGDYLMNRLKKGIK